MKKFEYEECIKACLDCAAVCHRNAAAALNARDTKLCIQVNMECAAICTASATLMSFDSKYSDKICSICINICEECARTCEKYNRDFFSDSIAACHHCIHECRKCHPGL